MKTGLKLATLGLVASLVALIWLWRINGTLASQNLRLARQNAELRSALKLAAQQASQVARDAVTLDTELGAAKITLTERNRRETTLLAEIATLRKDSSQAGTAAAQTDYQQRISALEEKLTALLARALSEPLPEEPTTISTPPAPVIEVVRLGPDDSFVILNCGTEQGVSAGRILALRRGTIEVARVQISDVRARHAIAQVLPGTLKGKLQTGDIALLTP